MRKATCLLLVLVCLVICCVNDVDSKFRLRRALKKVEKAVRKVVKPAKKVLKNVIEKPVRNILKAVGLKKVKKTYREFKQEATHARVIFTEDSYRVEKVTPCEAGRHDIVMAEQPTEIHFEDQVVILQDRYCRKCGEHFYTEPRNEL